RHFPPAAIAQAVFMINRRRLCENGCHLTHVRDFAEIRFWTH
ncbi:MAG: hypothetical protein ACI8W7_001417, partial [Gammaproteobacteria bacterium]